ncbi:MAG: helix-hairpin-helix domain-containing protein [Candidatus Omnitrophica bacterium]|nr:helix-hairpin-helix domain-containing protein [Candidatus Omnitrophota bacterium]
MWLTEKERMTASILGAVSLAALGTILWRQQRPPLVIEPALEQTAQWDAALVAARQVDVNTASVAELERLPGVGPTLARRIVDDRTVHGPFQRPEELQRVKGIGPQTYAGLKDHVTVP